MGRIRLEHDAIERTETNACVLLLNKCTQNARVCFIWYICTNGYYGDASSVVMVYQETGKPVMMQNVEIRNAE